VTSAALLRAAVLGALLAGAFTASGAQAPTAPPDATPRTLGEPPLCEPSAAIPAPWDGALTLVADNEVDDSLFGFELEGGSLAHQRRLPLPTKEGPRDIEALATVGDRILVVGSHSRNRLCQIRPARQRLLLARFEPESRKLLLAGAVDSSRTWASARKGMESCVAALFTTPAPAYAHRVCGALVAAEKKAREGEAGCTTLNIEGAVAVDSTSGGTPRVWLGLRSPLVEGDAVLLRLTPGLDELRFDAVALVGSGGRGIRELGRSGEVLWGILGAPDEGQDRPLLFRIPVAALAPGGRLSPADAASLPAASEGFVLDAGSVVAVIDGDRGSKERATCLVSGRQIRIPLR